MRSALKTEGLLGLPQELLGEILAHLQSIHDIRRLSLVCRDLHRRVDAALYSLVVLASVEDHESLMKALAAMPKRANSIRSLAIEYDDWIDYYCYDDRDFEGTLRQDIERDEDDAELLSSLRNLERLKIFSCWIDDERSISFATLLDPSAQVLPNLTYCEINFWQFEKTEAGIPLPVDFGPWLTRLFSSPTVEILILHMIKKGNIKTLVLDGSVRTPLKELCIGVQDIGLDIVANLMRMPKALKRFELCESSTWLSPEMDDLSIWVDAIRCQRETLAHFGVLGFKHTKSLNLDDFEKLTYLGISFEVLSTHARTSSWPPNIETLETYDGRHSWEPKSWHDYDYMDLRDDSGDYPWQYVERLRSQGAWPNLKSCIILNADIFVVDYSRDGVCVKKRRKDRECGWLCQNKSNRFSWDKSWFVSDVEVDEPERKLIKGPPY